MKTCKALALSTALLFACGGGSSQSAAPAAPLAAPASQPMAPEAGPMVAVDESLPEIPATPVPAPASVMTVLSLSNPNSQLTRIGTFFDAVQPGAGAFVTPMTLKAQLEGMVGVVGMEGLDFNGPLHVVVTGDSRMVLVATTASEAALQDSLKSGSTRAVTHQGYAAIGKPSALQEIAPYGLTTLVSEPVDDNPVLTLFANHIFASSQGPLVEQQLRELFGSDPAAQGVADIVLEALHNVSVVRASFDPAPEGLTLRARAQVTGGDVKAFIAKQSASSFAALERLGSGPWGFVAAGRLDLSFLTPLLVRFAEVQANPILMQISAQLAALNGEMAVALNLPKKPEMVMSVELAEAKGLAETVDALMGLAAKQKDMDLSGMKSNIKLGAIKTRAGSLHEIKMAPIGPELVAKYGKKGVSAFVGVVAGNLVATFGGDARKQAQVLAAASGKLPGKGTRLGAAVELAKSAGESIFLAMDPLALRGDRDAKDVSPVVLGAGFTAESVNLRVVIPTAFVQEAAAGI